MGITTSRHPYRQKCCSCIKNVLELTEKEIDELTEQIEKEYPDCIVHDGIAFWGKIAAARLTIPAVSLITTFATSKKMMLHYPQISFLIAKTILAKSMHAAITIRKFNALVKKYNVQSDGIQDVAVNKEKLNIVFTSRLIQPLSRTFDDSFHFVGTIVRDEPNTLFILFPTLEKDKPIIYISLGTIYNDDLHFFKTCINAFGESNFQIIMSVGQRIKKNELPILSKNFFIKDYLPQLAVLKYASLFITHGGMNSVNESLYFGVPMIVIPEIYEQKMNAIQVKRLRAGVYLPKQKLTEESLRSTVTHVLKTNRYKEQAIILQNSLQKAGGYKKATEEILAYLQTKK
ncbi:MAG: macrolide family glycosyltransferase [Candidatus Levyibacteriota bacterium]